MKKVLKFFLLIPLLFIAMSCFFACGDESVTSVNVFFPSTSTAVVDRGRYYLEYSTTPIQLDVSITPSKYSIRNLAWSTTASNIAYVNSDGKLVTAGDSGDVSIQAKYVNEDGTTVSSVILRFNISIDPLPNFANSTATGTYSGEDLKDKYVVQNAKPSTYEYVYYYIGDDSDSEEVDEIINSGEYLITYVKTSSQTKFAEMMLTVGKYAITKTAPDRISVFGESMPEDLFTSTPTQDDFLSGNDLIDGVGQDAGKVIGKYLYKTNATATSNVGIHTTSVVYVLGDEYEQNYTLISISGKHTITAKQVVVAINNQGITYGESPTSNDYALYDYQDYVDNGNSISSAISAITTENLTKRINTGGYVVLKNDSVMSKNSWGYIDAGTYNLSYDLTLLSTDANVLVKACVVGILTVEKKEVVITPDVNNSKNYTEEDNFESLDYTYAGFISNTNEIEPFLVINYQGEDYGTMNFKAPVGSYFYGIDNTINQNFTFSLTDSATSSYEGDDQIKFEVKQCPVVIKFDNIVEYFETPNGYDDENNPVPTVSYYSVMINNSIPNYELDSIFSLKLNDVEQMASGVCECALDDFENNGSFEFSTGETFKISLKLVAQTSSNGHYATYYVALQDSTSTEVQNYVVTVEKSYVYLDKINIIVTPSETVGVSTKVYSADSSISSLFYQDYILSGSMESGVDASSVFSTSYLLSLTDGSGLFYLKNANGTHTAVENVINCGTYKIFLSPNLTYASQMEYYNFSLDTSKNYYFTITQKQITITPNDNQGKIYGNADLALTYIYGNPISNLIVSGSLVRTSGENVGNYGISLGTLSFGTNYNLTLSETVKYYTISKRDITITPISYTTTFGDDYPTTIGYNDPLAGQAYDSSILVRPTFSGAFQLYYGESETPIAKVGSNYPVKIVNGEVVGYTIKQGTFECLNSNYNITVTQTSTYLVYKREATINIISENKSSADGISATFTNFTNYTLSSEQGVESVTLSGISFSATQTDDKYYISALSDITSLQVSKNSTDITDCYELSLGQNIVYYIASTIINLSIVGADDTSSSLVRVTYSGEVVQDRFKLVCTTDGFEINEDDSNYLIVYSTNESPNVTPQNAGSYYVSLNVGLSNTVVVTRSSNSEDIIFTSLNVKVSGCVLNLSQSAYLNISQADISFVEEELSFESSITYGSDETALPKINVTYDDNEVTKSIFTGVDGEEILLKEYENGKNFVFTSAPQSVRTLNASSSVTYSIKLTIQAVTSGGVLDTNYKSLTIDVRLTVVPREIIIDETTTLSYKGTYSTEGTIVYSGHASVFSLDVVTSTEGADYTSSYIYEGIETSYVNSVAGFVRVYSYTDGVVASTENTKSTSDLSISTIELVIYSGDRYYLINKESDAYCVKIDNQDATPKDAGIYLCIATCTAGDNFVFSGNVKSTSYCSLFEIERTSDIVISDWTSEFRWGTTFNLEDPSSLPFSYSMLPDFKSKVTYSVENEEDWEALGYVLAVSSSYQITLTIDEDNYYLSSPQTFAVISREAEIVFSTRTKYGFKGENVAIDLFLDDIEAILKDQNGVAIEEKKYIIDNTNFNLSFETEEGELCESIPWNAGNYVLTVTYGTTTSNYYGEGVFAYTIEKTAFSGEIAIVNAEIEYDPSATAEVLYNLIVGNMFSIEEGTSYVLTVKDEGGAVISTSNTNSWLSSINLVGVKKIGFTVSFPDDETISDYIGYANLTISARRIKTINFEIPTDDAQYSYSGNVVYNELKYSGTVNLAPKTINSSVQYVVGSSTYNVRTLAYNSVKLMDSLGNDIFTLTYNYYYQSASGSLTYIAMTSAPLTSKTVNYKVEYVFSNFGNNYSNKLDSSTITRYFTINKVSTLFISIFNDDDDNFDTSIVRDYSGGNYYNDIFGTVINPDETDLYDIIGVSNTSDTKDNIKKTISKSNVTYSSAGGVYIIVFFTNADGVVVTDLTNAGSYFLNISFLRNSNYSVSEFFEYVVFNASTTYATSTYFNSSSDYFRDANYTTFAYIYETYFSIPFTIEQIDCPYDSSNLTDVLIISEGGYEVVTEESGLNTTYILEFDQNTTFSLLVGTPFTLVIEIFSEGSYFEVEDDVDVDFYDAGEFYFDNLVVGREYSLMLVDENGNYKNSEHIRFRVVATPAE